MENIYYSFNINSCLGIRLRANYPKLRAPTISQ